jgi:hypothetical protein
MKIEIDFPDKIITQLLVSAFNGGSSYWLHSTEMFVPRRIAPGTEEDQKITRETLPLIEGGIVFVTLMEEARKGEGARYNLKRLDIWNGLGVMSRECPRQFGYALSGRGDADTADLFLQCCLFGEVIFG